MYRPGHPYLCIACVLVLCVCSVYIANDRKLLNSETMKNDCLPASKFRKWLMRNNKSNLPGLIVRDRIQGL